MALWALWSGHDVYPCIPLSLLIQRAKKINTKKESAMPALLWFIGTTAMLLYPYFHTVW
ncbi:MAG: hypothetical protein MUO58_00810 [Anaerolineales bacterium]|nr:hypothetical protein [Anaerolineales bacterium]